MRAAVPRLEVHALTKQVMQRARKSSVVLDAALSCDFAISNVGHARCIFTQTTGLARNQPSNVKLPLL